MDKKVKIKPKKNVKIIIFIFIILLLIFIYARYINTHGFYIKEIAVIDENLNDAYNGLKIVQFSDIHYGRTVDEHDLNNIIDKINYLNPDIIVFTGDLFDGENINNEDVNLTTKYFKKLEARLFKIAIIGDYDQKYLEKYQSILNNSNFILLDNNSKLIYDNCNIPINIIGLTNTTNINDLYNSKYFTITLIHQPDMIYDIHESNLVLAGHSMGGQIKIPFVGGIIKKEGAKEYINDYYEVNEQKLYISNGLGTENFSFRIFNKPSITMYRLYNY